MTKFEIRSPFPVDEVQKTGAQLDVLKKEGLKKEIVSATVGLAQTGKTEWQREAEDINNAVGKESNPGYNFAVLEKFTQEVVEKYLFDGETNGKNIAVIASSGGSDALSKIVGVLDGPIVPVGMPNWPNTRGIIEKKGGVVFPYLDLNTETGDFNYQNAIEVIQDLPDLITMMDDKQVQLFFKSQRDAFRKTTGIDFQDADSFGKTWFEAKMITPLLHAVCKNPTGIDVPEKVGNFSVWEKMADQLLVKDMILIVDAAYLGFGEGPQEDNRMIKYFADRGVKMMIAFSGSKLYNIYGDNRIGAVAAVNFEDVNDVKKKILYEGRNTTSAIGTDAQRFAVTVETNDDLSNAHKEWLAERRENTKVNRMIIADALRDPVLQKRITEGRGLFATLGEEFAEWIFPELAEKMGITVSPKAKDFPNDFARIATIITSDSSIGDGNVRLNMTQITQEEADKIGKTLAYAEERIELSK